MAVRIQLAESAEDRESVFRLRYRVYIEEMHRTQKYADHERRRIEEPLDATGKILIARDDEGNTVGTMRTNLGRDGGLGEYVNLYRLKEFAQFFPARISITTKLMVDREYRRSLLPMQITFACYKLVIEHGSRFDIIDCNPPLKGFFEKLGYQQVFPEIDHPEYGRVIPMVGCLLDQAHLDRVHSPFRKYARTIVDETGSVAFFHKRLCAATVA